MFRKLTIAFCITLVTVTTALVPNSTVPAAAQTALPGCEVEVYVAGEHGGFLWVDWFRGVAGGTTGCTDTMAHVTSTATVQVTPSGGDADPQVCTGTPGCGSFADAKAPKAP